MTQERIGRFSLALLGGVLVLVAVVAPPLVDGGRPSRAPAAVPAPALSEIQVGEASATGPYDRAAFGPRWSDDVSVPGGHNGCDTRDDVLRRDLVDAAGAGCEVRSGTLEDPYTGARVTVVSSIQIDHVYPLKLAWQHGASGWTAQRRRDFANDPRFLLAVAGRANESKGDRGPASWMPPRRDEWCPYANLFVLAAHYYGLTVSRADYDFLSTVIAACPKEGSSR